MICNKQRNILTHHPNTCIAGEKHLELILWWFFLAFFSFLTLEVQLVLTSRGEEIKYSRYTAYKQDLLWHTGILTLNEVVFCVLKRKRLKDLYCSTLYLNWQIIYTQGFTGSKASMFIVIKNSWSKHKHLFNTINVKIWRPFLYRTRFLMPYCL